MKIAKIEIRDVMGTKSASFCPGSLTVVRGSNASGKTSIIEALRLIFDGGHDPALIRHGAKAGQIRMELDNGVVMQKRITKSQTTVEIVDANGEPVKAPQTYINSLADSLAFDPVKILTAKPKELAGVLAEMMPFSLTASEVTEELKDWPVALTAARGAINGKPLDLDGIDKVRKAIYERRAIVNAAAKNADGTEARLKGALPPDNSSEDTRSIEERLKSQLVTHESKRSELMGALQTKIDAASATLAEQIEDITKEAERLKDQCRREAAIAQDAARAETAPLLDEVSSAIAEVQAQIKDVGRIEVLKGEIEMARKESRANNIESSSLTQAIEAIDELKRRKLSDCPIPGLTVREGRAYYGDIPFERVNTAERVKIAFQVSAMRSGSLPFMILDNAELMDDDTWREFEEGAKASGFQVIAARVADSPLTIEVI